MTDTIAIKLAMQGASVVVSASDQVSASFDKIGKAANTSTASSSQMATALGKVAAYGLAGGSITLLANRVIAVGEALFTASVNAQRLQTGLNFATGGNAAKELAHVTGLANRLGLELNATAQSYTGFAAAAKGTSIEGAKARAVFDAMGEASAVLGLSADQSRGALLAIQQMMSKGTVQAEEFRGQLGERMPIALQAATTALGVTSAEFNRMLQNGEVISADFLPKFAVAIREMLGDSVEDAANRLEASTNRMANSWERLKRTFGDSGVSQAIANEARGLGNYFDGLADTMDRAKQSGSGFLGQLNDGMSYIIGRAPFDILATGANALNGGINLLTGGVLGLRTNLTLLPDVFRTNAQVAAELDGNLRKAEAELTRLSARLAVVPDNIYLKDETHQAYLYVQQLRAAKKARDDLAGAGAGRGSVNPQSVEQMYAAQNRLAEAMDKYATKGEKAAAVIEALRKAHGALFTPEMEARVRAQLDPPTTSLSKAQQLIRDQAKSYDDWVVAINAKIAADNLELQSGEKLTAAQLERLSLDKQVAAGKLTSKAASSEETRVLLAQLQVSDALVTQHKASAKAIAEATDAYNKHMDALQEANGLAALELETGQDLSTAQKAAIKILQDITNGTRKYTAEQTAALATELERSIILERQAAQRAAQLASDKQSFDNLQQEVQALRDGNTALVLHNEEIGLTGEALNLLTVRRLDDAIAIQESIVAEYRGIDARARDVVAMQLQIDKLDELKRQRDLTTTGQLASAKADIEKLNRDAGQKMSDDINRSLTDALFRGFEDGKSFAKNLRDSVINMFKTMVLRPVISAIMSPISGAATSALGFSGAANAASGADGASSLLGMGSMFGSGGLTGALSAGAGWLTGATSLSGALSAGASLIGTGTTAGLASGVGMLAGALGPIALGIGVLSSLFGSKKPKVKSLGDADITFDAEGGVISKKTDYGHRTNFNESSDSFVRGLSQQYQDMAAALGAGKVQTNFGFSSNDEKGGHFRISGNGFNSGEIDTSSDAITLATQRVLFAALKSSDLPAYLAGAFNSLDAQTATADQIGAAVNAAQALKVFYDQLKNSPFESLRDVSGDAFASLLNFSGGVELLTSNLDAYYENFYSAEEKRQNTIENMVARINAAGGSVRAGDFADGGSLDSRPEYRALVESAGDGSPLQAVLFSLAGAFAELTPEVAGLSATASQSAADLQQAAERLASINKGWQDQLDILTGAETERSIALRDATDDSTRALMRQVWAQQDLTAATLAAAAAFAQATQDQLSAATSAASAAYDGLARAIEAQKAADIAAYEAQRAIAQAAYTSQTELLQDRIDGAKGSLDSITDTVGKLKSLSSSLRSTLNGLRISGTEAQTRASAQQLISSALATARNGGGLPVNGELTQALSVIGQPSEDLFATFQDYARDFYRTANDISALNDLSDSQLTEAEVMQAEMRAQVELLTDQKRLLKDGFDAQVSALDDILANARKQLDTANGINIGVLSVVDAMRAFNAAIGKLEAVRAAQVLPTTPGVASPYQDFVGPVPTGGLPPAGPIAAGLEKGPIADFIAGKAPAAAPVGTGHAFVGPVPTGGLPPAGPIAAGFEKGPIADFIAAPPVDQQAIRNKGIVDYVKAVLASGMSGSEQAHSIANEAKKYGATELELAAALGFSPSDMRQYFAVNNIPQFAVGTNRVPRDMLAMVHKDETIRPAAYNGQLEALVTSLIQEVRQLRAAGEQTAANTNRTAETLDGRQGQPLRVTVEAA